MNICVVGSKSDAMLDTLFVTALHSKRGFKPWKDVIKQFDRFLDAGYEQPNLDPDEEYMTLLDMVINQKRDISLSKMARDLKAKEIEQ